jgi:dTDP-4-amino-4,6-dideoxygalactose transaminase
MKNAHDITRDFEQALCEYTGAPFAVAVNSCTMALLLAVRWCLQGPKIWFDGGHSALVTTSQPVVQCVSIPRHTYVSVPQSIIHAGGKPVFRDEDWVGNYQLSPLPVWDSARLFTSGMYRKGYGEFVCLSFHVSKTLGDTQGGAILHDDPEADRWFHKARCDGREEGVAPKYDKEIIVGWHCYMNPDTALRLLWRMSTLPEHNDPLPNDDYPDLSQLECFK